MFVGLKVGRGPKKSYVYLFKNTNGHLIAILVILRAVGTVQTFGIVVTLLTVMKVRRKNTLNIKYRKYIIL